MTKITLLLIGLTLITSCSPKHVGEKKKGLISNFINITDNEDKGIKEILAFYGGYCEYSIGSTIGSEGTEKYFELKMTESGLLEKLAAINEMPSSNIAYLFYKNLTQEKVKYSYIKVVIELKNKGISSRSFQISDLKILEQKIDVIYQVSDLISKSNFEKLFALIDKSAIPDLTLDKVTTLCKQVENQCGTIDSLTFQGFSFFKLEDGTGLLHLAGIQSRKKQNIPLSIIINPKKESIENSIESIKFDF
jgi:hypothetical protein